MDIDKQIIDANRAGDVSPQDVAEAGKTATSGRTASASGSASGSGRTASASGSGSPIEFRLDPASGVPTYLQLVHQVEHALRLGYLKPGDQLPKVRDAVAALAINPNTVLKAYKELETKGLAAGRPGQGTFVQATLSQVALPELAGLRKSLLGWLSAAETAGLDEDGMVALFTSVLRDFYKRRAGRPDRGAASGETEGVA
jgi:GntR family transcriptional regulator